LGLCSALKVGIPVIVAIVVVFAVAAATGGSDRCVIVVSVVCRVVSVVSFIVLVHSFHPLLKVIINADLQNFLAGGVSCAKIANRFYDKNARIA
jgi:Na+-transporting NADH:ubiquinone oxidoreductase subunit NqrD